MAARAEPAGRPGGAAGPGAEACSRGSRACAGPGEGAGVRAQPASKGPGWNEQVPGRGRRESWNGRHPARGGMLGPGTRWRSERGREGTRDGRSGAPAVAATEGTWQTLGDTPRSGAGGAGLTRLLREGSGWMG